MISHRARAQRLAKTDVFGDALRAIHGGAQPLHREHDAGIVLALDKFVHAVAPVIAPAEAPGDGDLFQALVLAKVFEPRARRLGAIGRDIDLGLLFYLVVNFSRRFGHFSPRVAILDFGFWIAEPRRKHSERRHWLKVFTRPHRGQTLRSARALTIVPDKTIPAADDIVAAPAPVDPNFFSFVFSSKICSGGRICVLPMMPASAEFFTEWIFFRFRIARSRDLLLKQIQNRHLSHPISA